MRAARELIAVTDMTFRILDFGFWIFLLLVPSCLPAQEKPDKDRSEEKQKVMRLLDRATLIVNQLLKIEELERQYQKLLDEEKKETKDGSGKN